MFTINLCLSFIRDRYYLNGNRLIVDNSIFQVGQTRMWYERRTKHETLESRGSPLIESVDIMLLLLHNDPIKIKCSYWERSNGTTANTTKMFHNYYRWSFDNETTNDCACDVRQPQCTFQSHTRERIVVSDRLCDAKLKPRSLKCRNVSCSSQFASIPRWQTGSWRTCEGRCWPQEAVQRRSLLCVRSLADNRTHTIPTSICTHWLGHVPITVRECPKSAVSTIPKCSSVQAYEQWITGEWSGVSEGFIGIKKLKEKFSRIARQIRVRCNIDW